MNRMTRLKGPEFPSEKKTNVGREPIWLSARLAGALPFWEDLTQTSAVLLFYHFSIELFAQE